MQLELEIQKILFSRPENQYLTVLFGVFGYFWFIVLWEERAKSRHDGFRVRGCCQVIPSHRIIVVIVKLLGAVFVTGIPVARTPKTVILEAHGCESWLIPRRVGIS